MFERARNINDAGFSPAPWALPAAASTSTNSTSVDLGLDAMKPEDMEVEISVPALGTVIVPDTKTVRYIIETSTDTAFGSVDQTLFDFTQTGAGGVGVPALTKRVRVPSNCVQFLHGKITFGALTTDGSAVLATLRFLF